MRFFRRWGAIVILVIMWAASTFGFWYFERQVEQHDAEDHQTEFSEDEFRDRFWAGTFENLQSEWAQLAVQGGLFIGAGAYVFLKQKEDIKRLETKIDRLTQLQGGSDGQEG